MMLQDAHPPNIYTVLIALITAIPTIITVWWTNKKANEKREEVKRELIDTNTQLREREVKRDDKLEEVRKDVNSNLLAAKQEIAEGKDAIIAGKNAVIAANAEIASIKDAATAEIRAAVAEVKALNATQSR